MSPRKKNIPTAPAAVVPAAVAKPPIAADVLVERILVGGLTALIVARALVAGDDPGRLRLTSGSGPLALNAFTFLVALGWAVWRGWAKPSRPSNSGWFVAIGLLATAGLVFVSTALPDRYQRPGWFIAWDWVAIAALCFLTWQLATSDAVMRGLMAVLLATAVSLSAQALYQKMAVGLGLPSNEIDPLPPPALPLVGDEGPGRLLNQPAPPLTPFRATFEQPDTLAGFLLLLLPAAVVFAFAGWRAGGRSRLALIVPAVMLIATLIALGGFLFSTKTRAGGRQIVGDLIQNSPFFGVGPGNFSRHWGFCPASPAGFWGGFAATAGILALAAALTTLAVVIGLQLRRKPAAEAAETPRTGPRWEFYLGGIAGLLLGMMLATGDIPAEAPADEMLRLGSVAAGRALVWFVVFGFLENVTPNAGALRRSLLAGVVLAGLLGIISDGLASPALLQPFWLAATLALAAPGAKRNIAAMSLPRAWAAVPIALALVVANVVHVGLPGIVTASAAHRARQASKDFPHKLWQMEGKSGLDWIAAVHDADGYLTRNVLGPLRDAAQHDPDNSALQIELARWRAWHWRFMRNLRHDAVARDEGARMLAASERAAQIDARNLAGKRATFDTLLLFAAESMPIRNEHLVALEKVIGEIAEREPVLQVSLRYRVVQMLLTKKNAAAVDAWAVRVLSLDREQSARYGSLTDDERARLIEALRKALVQPSAELIPFLYGDG